MNKCSNIFYRSTIFILVFFVSSVSAQDEIKTLVDKIKIAKNDSARSDLYYELSEICPEEEIQNYASKALQLAEKVNYKKGIAAACNNLGFAYANFSRDLFKALNFYQRSLDVSKELNDNRRIGTLYSNMGYVMEKLGENEKALDYYRNSHQKAIEVKDTLLMTISAGNIGQAWADLGNEDSSYFYIKRSYEINEPFGDFTAKSTALNNLGMYYHRKGMHDTALTFLLEDTKILERTNDKRGLTYNLVNVAKIYEIKGQPGLAESLALKAFHLANELRVSETMKTSSELLSRIYFRQNKFKEAYTMLHYNKRISDSVLTVNIREKILESQLKFEFKQQTTEAKADQEKKDAIAAERDKQQKRVIGISLAGLLLAIIFIILVYRGYLEKQKSNIEISKQKGIIESKQKEIVDSIKYAQRIQQSLMPSEKYIERNIKNKL